MNDKKEGSSILSLEKKLNELRAENTKLKNIVSHLGVKVEEKQNHTDLMDFALDSVLNHQLVSLYGVHAKTYELVYMNEEAKRVFPQASLNKACYEAIWGRKRPCENCPINSLRANETRTSIEMYNEKNMTWYSAMASRVKDEPMYLIGWRDITAFIESVKAKDPLTGFLTLGKFEAEALKLLETKGQTRYALVYADFNRFKCVNDECGYAVGDQVLKLFAEQVHSILLENELGCRVSGDEFIFLLTYDKGEALLHRLKLIYEKACRTLESKYHPMHLTISSGIYYIQEQVYNMCRIIDYANLARNTLKVFKSYEHHEFAVYDEVLHRQETRKQVIEAKMQRALLNKEFEVYLQPKIDLSTQKIKGIEALVRWLSTEGELFYPNEFIPIFEKNGFIGKLDFYVYEEVFKAMRRWLNAGKEMPIVSINVSRISLKDPNFIKDLLELIEKYELPTSLIELELTENIFFENLDRLLERINCLREKGFLVSIDDFGTGYSTLNLVQVLPVDILKLDKGFFGENELGTKARTIIMNIIKLAKELGLKVIAEGVETREQALFLRELHCEMAQGYYYYKPMPIEVFETLF